MFDLSVLSHRILFLLTLYLVLALSTLTLLILSLSSHNVAPNSTQTSYAVSPYLFLLHFYSSQVFSFITALSYSSIVAAFYSVLYPNHFASLLSFTVSTISVLLSLYTFPYLYPTFSNNPFCSDSTTIPIAGLSDSSFCQLSVGVGICIILISVALIGFTLWSFTLFLTTARQIPYTRHKISRRLARCSQISLTPFLISIFLLLVIFAVLTIETNSNYSLPLSAAGGNGWVEGVYSFGSDVVLADAFIPLMITLLISICSVVASAFHPTLLSIFMSGIFCIVSVLQILSFYIATLRRLSSSYFTSDTIKTNFDILIASAVGFICFVLILILVLQTVRAILIPRVLPNLPSFLPYLLFPHSIFLLASFGVQLALEFTPTLFTLSGPTFGESLLLSNRWFMYLSTVFVCIWATISYQIGSGGVGDIATILTTLFPVLIVALSFTLISLPSLYPALLNNSYLLSIGLYKPQLNIPTFCSPSYSSSTVTATSYGDFYCESIIAAAWLALSSELVVVAILITLFIQLIRVWETRPYPATHILLIVCSLISLWGYAVLAGASLYSIIDGQTILSYLLQPDLTIPSVLSTTNLNFSYLLNGVYAQAVSITIYLVVSVFATFTYTNIPTYLYSLFNIASAFALFTTTFPITVLLLRLIYEAPDKIRPTFSEEIMIWSVAGICMGSFLNLFISTCRAIWLWLGSEDEDIEQEEGEGEEGGGKSEQLLPKNNGYRSMNDNSSSQISNNRKSKTPFIPPRTPLSQSFTPAPYFARSSSDDASSYHEFSVLNDPPMPSASFAGRGGCVNCGRINPSSFRFCAACGSQLLIANKTPAKPRFVNDDIENEPEDEKNLIPQQPAARSLLSKRLVPLTPSAESALQNRNASLPVENVEKIDSFSSLPTPTPPPLLSQIHSSKKQVQSNISPNPSSANYSAHSVTPLRGNRNVNVGSRYSVGFATPESANIRSPEWHLSAEDSRDQIENPLSPGLEEKEEEEEENEQRIPGEEEKERDISRRIA